MRFKAKPFTHPEYDSLKQRSEFWPTVWGMGHLTFIIYSAVACLIPAGLVALALLVPQTRKGLLYQGASMAGASLFVAAIGFAIKKYASKQSGKGRSLQR